MPGRADNRHTIEEQDMTAKPLGKLKDGAHCTVTGGTHKGKSGTVRDIKTGKTGHVSITVEQSTGVRFKTLARNVMVQTKPA
jgi:ribosomal protein S4E